jgi:hypothetical protein
MQQIDYRHTRRGLVQHRFHLSDIGAGVTKISKKNEHDGESKTDGAG